MEYMTRIRHERVLLPFDVENGLVSAIMSRDKKRIIILYDTQYRILQKKLTESGMFYLASRTRTAEINNNCLYMNRNFSYSDDIVTVRPLENRISVDFLAGHVELSGTNQNKRVA